MRVKILEKSMSTSEGIKRNGDVVTLPDAEIKKIQKMKPNAFEILADEKPITFARKPKKAKKDA